MVAVLAAAQGRALDWQSRPGYRVARLNVPPTGKTGFTVINAAEIGVDFTNALSDSRTEQFQNLMNGAGVAAADFDGDGRTDLYFVHKQSANQLYRNLGGWRFTNVTAGSGAACSNQSSVGVVAGDVNGDGAVDLAVSSFGGPHALLINDGHGRFKETAGPAGITGASGGTSMALGDLGGLGALDLYFCNFAVEAILRDGAAIATRMIDGRPVVTGRYARRLTIANGKLMELGDPDALFWNDGRGRFTPATWEKTFTDASARPMAAPPDFGLAVQIRDINGDGYPDIYVCNDFQTPDRLWLGDGHGRFRESPPTAQRNMSYASMGVDFADIDRDGRMDFITLEMLDPNLGQHLRTSSPMQPTERAPGHFEGREDFARNCLYHQRGDGTFEELACFAGVAATSWSWTPLFLDVDLDGWEDLLVSNGHLHDVNNRDISAQSRREFGRTIQPTKNLLSRFPPLTPPKFAFRNRRDLTFEDRSADWGFNSTRVAHGMIAADLDDDGDLDVILNCIDGPPLIYRNDCDRPRVAVRLRGRAPNTAGIGAKITLQGGPVIQTQEVIAGGQYLSSSDPLRVFAAGKGRMSLAVEWRSGRRSEIAGVEANCLYEIDEPVEGNSARPATSPSPAPLFVDASERLAHTHHEEAFDDFGQQPLLFRRLSQLGPSVVAADFDGDGKADLAVGAGRGGRVAVKFGDGRGGFDEGVVPVEILADDALGMAAWTNTDGTRSLYVSLANYESGDASQPAALRWDFDGRTIVAGPPLPSIGSSPGVVTIGDFDGRGAADLFVGGRVTAKRWPEPAASRLFHQQGGRWDVNAADSPIVAGTGLVTGALFADLDGDGRPELALSTEYGPLRIFRKMAGVLSVWDPPTTFESRTLPLSEWTGWWSSVAVADLDGDGKPDLIAGNWGLNSVWQVWGDGKPAAAYGDFFNDGVVSVVESIRVDGILRPWRDRDFLARGFPDLPARFPMHSGFSEATLDAVLGRHRDRAHLVAVRTLASVVLFNRVDHFDMQALPAAAQWSPVNAVVVADFDGDGKPDVFLAQNCFSVRPEDMRLDSGRGLWLRNNGAGALTPVSGESSGVIVYGDQRGAAVADFDGDGRPDLAVTQNGAATRLFLNRAGSRPR